MAKDKFDVTYNANNEGGAHPQHVSISNQDFFEYESEEQLRALFWEAIEEDFRQKVSATSGQEEQFIEWAKKQQAAMRAKEAEEETNA